MNTIEPSSSPVMTLTDAAVRYRRRRATERGGSKWFWALDGVTMEVRSGEVLGVIGRNGAGKSTLLKMLAGIIRPDRGDMINHGYRASLLSIAAGFDNYLSGRQNIVLSGMLLGRSRRDMLERMDDIIDAAELRDFIDQPVSSYSTGMRARLGFCTSFFVDPPVILVDEILGVGDAKFGEKSAAMLREKIHSDRTAVLVSHSEHRLKELCTRMVWIENGRLEAEGTPEEVWGHYRDFYRAYKGITTRGPAR